MSARPQMTGDRVATVASPCISVCRIDPGTGWCEGCLRTIDEIAAWGSMSNGERAAVIEELRTRAPALERDAASGGDPGRSG